MLGERLDDQALPECVRNGFHKDRLRELPGQLVLRVLGRPASTEPRYRQPALPSRFAEGVADSAPRSVIIRNTGGELRDEGIVSQVEPADAASLLERGLVDVLYLPDIRFDDRVRALLKNAHEMHVPTAYVAATDEGLGRRHVRLGAGLRLESGWSALDDEAFLRLQTLRASEVVVCLTASAADFARRQRKRVLEARGVFPGGADTLAFLSRDILRAHESLHRPVVSIVTILYNKARELPAVLASYERQTYAGEIELVFVDDASPDNSVEVVERWAADRSNGRSVAVRIIRNGRNLGNCRSRNVGIAAARGDLLVVIDADCMLNRDFIRAHVEAHAFDDCEAVIGPLNIETRGAAPAEVLERYALSPGLALAHSELQDPVNKPSLLNCITRNFSVKREAIVEELFDPAFSYSADPSSGFGWEDVEMGYRLYKRGGRIKFAEEAFSVHVSSAIDPSQGNKPARSMRNFRRLFETHPELALVARRWSRETFARISNWADHARLDVQGDRAWLGNVLGEAGTGPLLRTQPRRLRVLTYRWHVPHQYELYKLPFDVTLLTGLGSPMTESWEFGQRPMPANARFADFRKVDPREFDLAILHFDENVLTPENTNGVIGSDWGAAFRWFREQLPLPKVAICHGTPQFYGQYTFDYRGLDLMHPIEAERRRLVDFLGEIPVVCNSHQAMREWQFRNARVIWHGFDPAEFPPATYEKGIVSPLGPLVMSRPHYRGYFLYREVFDGHFDELRPETLRVPEPHVAYTGNAYAAAKYRNYVDELRRYTVYFNPTLRSPMPRARAEPMMCGVVPVSAKNHDVDMFIQNGINGFYGESADELRDQLRFLMRNPDEARRIGANARRTAMDVFNYDRFLAQWKKLARELLG